jgi:transposase-like protein
VLVELGLVEQRYEAVLEVLNDGASVTDVARRYGVGRQAVHAWLRRYAAEDLGGLVDRSARPDACPHQMPPTVEARVLELLELYPWTQASAWAWACSMAPAPSCTAI